jgi:penicillin-binding protein 1C
MGFDDGVLVPDTVINDAPTRFGDYAPVNFNKGYMGEVTARTALQQSLNIPAVAVLDRVGATRFAQALSDVGAPLTLPRLEHRGAPGLPIVLGGVGLSLEKLVTLYAGLADDGRVAPLRLRAGDPRPDQQAPRLVGPEAAAMVARILADTPPPDGVAAFAAERRRIAFKTGTSYGFRDAWAVGFSGRYTVGVWVGRPDGTPSPDHWGHNTAAPLLFRLFDLLPAEPSVEPEPEVAAELPATMKRLALRSEAQRPLSARRGERPLRILFPAEDSTINPHDGRLPLKVAGGRMPLTWLIDGRPLDAPAGRRDLFWPPGSDGFKRLTVIDAEGASASVEFRVVR